MTAAQITHAGQDSNPGHVRRPPRRRAGRAGQLGILSRLSEVREQPKDAGGDAEMMHLPEIGIKGNSHMLMQDRTICSSPT